MPQIENTYPEGVTKEKYASETSAVVLPFNARELASTFIMTVAMKVTMLRLCNKITFPDGIVLSVDNKTEKDGWFWSDNPPQEYLDWLEQQNN